MMIENYMVDRFGVIHQIDYTPIKYDKEYISYYEDLSDRTIKLGYQRLGWVLGLTGEIPRSVLEIGYGTGTFIEAAKITGVADCAGFDIAKFPLPEGVRFVDWDEVLATQWDLVAMFDVLEHIPDLDFLSLLRTRYLAVAVPYCRWRELGSGGDAWFETWRMRLPNEHLHHFDRDSLVALLAHSGFECLALNCFEDGIRLRPGEAVQTSFRGFSGKASCPGRSRRHPPQVRLETPMREPRVRRREARAPRHHDASLDRIPRRLANPWPPLEVLSEDALQRVMDAAYLILEEAGLEFRSARALDILARNGADVDRSTQMVRFNRDLVKHFCGLAPRVFSLHSRNPEHEVVFGGNIINFSSANGMPNASDLDRGRRYGDYKTLCDLISLNNALGVIHLSGGEMVEPMDIAVHLRPAKMIYAHIRYGDLVWAARGIGRQPVLDAVEMARISRGIGLEELASKPSFYVITNTNSPRRIDEELLEGAMVAAEYGQAVCVTPFTLAGAMAPITLAGALALQTAEAIAVIALTQMVRPGAPAIYGGFTSNVDMRTGSPAFGTPEYVRATIAGGQIARQLGLPYRTSSVNSSCAVDAQAVYETSFALLAAVMSHGNFINHATGWLEGGLTNSFEKIIIDAEMLRGWAASLQPIDVSDDDLAVEAVKDVAPGGHFFASAHTMSRFETAFYRPLISDWRSFETWKEAGSRTATERARDLWPKILKAYEPPALDPAIDEELRAYIARRTAEPAP